VIKPGEKLNKKPADKLSAGFLFSEQAGLLTIRVGAIKQKPAEARLSIGKQQQKEWFAT
jgi:hypothetical protein